MALERELIPLARLRLNKENDRHGTLGSELACIEWLLANHRDHMLNLAKDIAEHGLSPIEGILVLPAEDGAPGDYDVWEGNRRVAALKLLDDPNRCPDERLRRRFTGIKSKAKPGTIVDTLECTIAANAEEVDRLIELRHQGPLDGVGTVGWDPRQKDRHRQRLGRPGRYSFSRQVIDAVADKVDDALREKIAGRDFAISTLDRILKNTHAREFLGLSTESGEPQLLIDEKEALKGITRVLQDVADGMPVKEVYSSAQIREYLDGFDKKDRPDTKKVLAKPKPLSAASTTAAPKKRSRSLSHDRRRLIPSDCKFSIKHKRLNAIYSELRSLAIDTRRNAVAVLFRVFLELSVEEYLDAQGVRFTAEDKLSNKAQMAVNHMAKSKWIDRQKAKGINAALASRHKPHAVDTFHSYVHNASFHPIPSDLNAAWDNLQPFFEVLFDHLS